MSMSVRKLHSFEQSRINFLLRTLCVFFRSDTAIRCQDIAKNPSIHLEQTRKHVGRRKSRVMHDGIN